ncbi:hypothetical protein [Vibrio sp. C8]
MKLEFFSLSDTAFKFRRNLLFTCSICFVHFSVTPLSSMKVFNVDIPEQLLVTGIPACLLWFTFNYFYCLYAEYTEWKASHIDERKILNDPTDYSKGTIIPEISVYTPEKAELKLKFELSSGYLPNTVLNDARLNDGVKNLVEHAIKNFHEATASDMKRIELFRNALARYQIANRVRLYLLDCFIPLAFSFYCIYLTLRDVNVLEILTSFL